MPRELLFALCLLLATAAHTARASAPTTDERAEAVSHQLRCLVCQNQTIAESNAELAVDLRRQVRELLAEGKSEEQILAFMTERYGDFVVYRPPLRSSTMLLWFGPALLLVGGALGLAWRIRRMRPAAPLQQAEYERAERLLRPGKEDTQ
ncbi:cytochrome c-type biogenesis protein CcmH [Massilia oculi]|uniref:Cytochrome c-type biogenesis protein n=1 Tax=Massilia hydrophila TaxID=3044279 RepID=A0ABS7Y420_9BURK|nr:cytochrome c-type biogenesis protein [Massilia oculi]MCA1854408.1 cytochrome c-type biogenesis protein CcmH [Massilia oculi]